MLNDASSLAEWLQHIDQGYPSNINLGLEHLQPIAECLAICNLDFPVIHIAGTNGKGSTVRSLELLYHAAGYKTAAITSPHFIDFNERLRLNSKVVDDPLLCQAFAEVEAARGDTELTYFEFTTFATLVAAKLWQPDVLLLEVGLGGRLDASNVVHSDCAVITSIALDHTAILGPDRESIGFEKAGIIEPNHPVVCGDMDMPASIGKVVTERRAQLYLVGHEFSYTEEADSWSFTNVDVNLAELVKPQLLLANVATALQVLSAMKAKLPVAEQVIRHAMPKLALTGRLQRTEFGYCDVAHNPQSAALLAKHLHQHRIQGQRLAVFSILNTKDMLETLRPMLAEIDAWYIADLQVQRSASVDEIQASLCTLGVKTCYTFSSIAAAFAAAKQAVSGGDELIVWGSFHAVGQVQAAQQAKRD